MKTKQNPVNTKIGLPDLAAGQHDRSCYRFPTEKKI